MYPDQFLTWIWSTTVVPGRGKVVSIVDTNNWDGALQSALAVKSTRTCASIAYGAPIALLCFIFMTIFGMELNIIAPLFILLIFVAGKFRRYPVDIVVNSAPYVEDGEPVSFDIWLDN